MRKTEHNANSCDSWFYVKINSPLFVTRFHLHESGRCDNGLDCSVMCILHPRLPEGRRFKTCTKVTRAHFEILWRLESSHAQNSKWLNSMTSSQIPFVSFVQGWTLRVSRNSFFVLIYKFPDTILRRRYTNSPILTELVRINGTSQLRCE